MVDVRGEQKTYQLDVCPFCGGDKLLICFNSQADRWAIYCHFCRLESVTYDWTGADTEKSQDFLVEQWNNRQRRHSEYKEVYPDE